MPAPGMNEPIEVRVRVRVRVRVPAPRMNEPIEVRVRARVRVRVRVRVSVPAPRMNEPIEAAMPTCVSRAATVSGFGDFARLRCARLPDATALDRAVSRSRVCTAASILAGAAQP